jgi:hypothetical protein
MIIPRALVGSIRAMARPRRPQAEIEAVCEASEIVRIELRVTASQSIAEEIARRVILALDDYLAMSDDDAISSALRDLSGTMFCPFVRLATDAEIDTYRDFMACRIEQIVAEMGRFISNEREARKRQTYDRLNNILVGRYARMIRQHEQSKFRDQRTKHCSQVE